MSLLCFVDVLGDRRFRGDYRLAMMALADAGGCARTYHIAHWINCDEREAEEILSEIEQSGIISRDISEDGDVFWSCGRLEAIDDPKSFRVHHAPFGRQPIPREIRIEIMGRGQCEYCGAEDGPFHIDHIFPVSRGGTNAVSNLALACAACNLSKGAKTVEEWRGGAQ